MTNRVTIAVALLALLTVIPALVQGHYANRWGTPADLSDAAERLQAFPKSFGEWKYVADREKLPPVVYKELGLAGYVSREYQNSKTGASVTCLLMIGQPGKLLRHEPDICYANRANKQEGSPIETKLSDTSTDKFRTLRYTSPSAIGERFTVTYGMRTDSSRWDVPYWRRLEFTGGTHLFKLQVLSTAQSGDFERSVETSKAFLLDFGNTFDNWLRDSQPGNAVEK